MSSPFLRRVAWILPLASSPLARAGIVDVHIQGSQFTERHVTIQVGDTVRWTNHDGFNHTTTEGTDLVLNGNEAWHNVYSLNEQFTVTFDAAFLAANPRPGNEYSYFCVPHTAGMRGSIKVASGPGLPFCFCPVNNTCFNQDHGAGCVNSSSIRGARMLGSGSTSVAADDLQLIVDLLPVNQPTVLISGKAQIAPTPMGDGMRCIGPSFFRLASGSTGPNGMFARGPGILNSAQNKAHVQAGQTWRYQLWYRDNGFFCQSGSNVSNGYAVTFTP